MSAETKTPDNATLVHRFAHPFFESKTSGGKTMIQHIIGTLEPFPISKGDAVMKLEDIIGGAGVRQIVSAKSITFHCVGDTGHENGEAQTAVSNAMTKDYDISKPGNSPALFIHLGDVNYYKNNDVGYHAQFYEPYVHYPGKIIAIPGNHDGELFKYDGSSVGQTKSLEAFDNNFCMDKPGIPSAAGSIYRQMYNQPGVYWLLKSPFADVIGLYSNCAENPGFISGATIGFEQKKWLTNTLKAIKAERISSGKKKALLIATHHPPLSHSGHSGSVEMLADIDGSCHDAGIMYDAFLSGHAHNYQRFTRTITANGKSIKIPYLVAGTGGRGITLITNATGSATGDYTYDKSSTGYGYLNINVSATTLTITFIQVDDKTGNKNVFDKVMVTL